MKYIILIMLSLNAYSATVSQYISSPEGSSMQSFHLSKGGVTYNKKSNFFDSTKDFSLGSFALKDAENISIEEKELAAILSRIKEVDTFLKKKNSSFNELSSGSPHESFLVLDNYRVTKSSDLYPDLKKIYDSLSTKKWKHVNGVRITPDFKNIISIKNGKDSAQEAFNMQFNCKDDMAPTVCAFKDLGILFIQ